MEPSPSARRRGGSATHIPAPAGAQADFEAKVGPTGAEQLRGYSGWTITYELAAEGTVSKSWEPEDPRMPRCVPNICRTRVSPSERSASLIAGAVKLGSG